MDVLPKTMRASSERTSVMDTSSVQSKFDSVLDKPLAARFQLRRAAEPCALMALDLVGLVISFSLAMIIRVHILPAVSGVFPADVSPDIITTLWWLPLVLLLFSAYEGLYGKRQPFWRELYSLVQATSLAFLVVLAIISLGKLHNQVSRTAIVITWINTLVALPLARYAGKNLLARIGIWQRKVLVLGAGKTGELVAKALAREPYLGYKVCGFLDDDPVKKTRGVQVNGVRYPVLGGFRDSDAVMEAMGVRHLIVAAPGMPARALVGLVNRLQRRAETVLVVPDLFGLPVVGIEADYFFDEQALIFKVRNNLANRVNAFLKRTFDLAAGTLILILILPIMAIIALAIKLDSPGPVFFANRRIGRGGKEFECYKFRTMHLNNEKILDEYLRQHPDVKHEWEKYAKLKGYDPRLTHVGRLLRKWSLDELPQVFNVIKGEMSLVGPRPYLPRERMPLSQYGNVILLARPGITGLWQVNGRNEVDFSGRLQLESWYVRNWSLWLDITILIRTFGVVLARRGAY